VVDTSSKTLIATIPVPGVIAGGIAVSSNGQFAYVTNSLYLASSGINGATGSNLALGLSLQIIQTSTNSVVASIAMPGVSRAVTLSPDGRSAYVTVDALGAGLLVVNTVTRQVEAKISLSVPNIPDHLSIAPNGDRIYVNNLGKIYIIDTATNSITATADLSHGDIDGVASMPDGSRAYVVGSLTEPPESIPPSMLQAWVVSATGGLTAAGIPLLPREIPENPSHLVGVAMAPNGRTVYVPEDVKRSTDLTTNVVRVIDTGSNTVTDTLLLPTDGVGAIGPADLAPDGRHLYVAAKHAVLAIEFDH
jgi:YVTN family beta-propeller protein